MTMSATLPLADVKAHLSELVGRVSREHDRVTVTVHGKPSAVLVAVEDLESLEETIAILSDSDAMRQLVQSDAELAWGEGECREDLAEAMRLRRSRARAKAPATNSSSPPRHGGSLRSRFPKQSRPRPTSSPPVRSWTTRNASASDCNRRSRTDTAHDAAPIASSTESIIRS